MRSPTALQANDIAEFYSRQWKVLEPSIGF